MDKTIAIVALIIAILALGLAASGISKTNNLPVFQSGPIQCTLRNSVSSPSSGTETDGCSGQINFPFAFTSIPTKYGISLQCLANTNQTLTGRTADQVCDNLSSQGHSFSSVLTYLSFESDNGTTWINMPVATTELYGNSNRETIAADWLGVQQAGFTVNIINTSVGANATLRPQCFDQTNGVFIDLPGLFIEVDLFPGPTATGLGFVVPAHCRNIDEVLRVVGQHGNGVGDLPRFNNIQIYYSVPVPLSINPHIGTNFGSAPNDPQVTKSFMRFDVSAINIQGGLGSLVPIFNWWACTC